MTAGGGKIGKLKLPGHSRVADAAPAPYIDLPKPGVTFAKGADGRLTVHVDMVPGERVIQLRLSANTAATLVEAGGVPLHMVMKPGGDTDIQWTAAPKGFDLVIRPGGPGKLTLDYSATLERWPGGVPPAPKRPANADALRPVGQLTADLEGSRTWSWCSLFPGHRSPR